ncbi:MAG: lipid-A-disaccharide synthase N-terminal domain-containing protein [Bacteroidales bacterium]
MSLYLIYAIGFLAQLLFSARLLVQWIASEKANKVLSPTLFWQLSMVASFILCIYGWLRDDFAIILGQIISYYIYIWNLQAKDAWSKVPKLMSTIFLILPLLSVLYFLANWDSSIDRLFKHDNIPIWLIIFGIVGQFTFTLRFIYQWAYSRQAGESLLPRTFWTISIIGSAMIISYAIIRHDPVLIIGQASGLVVYIRNIMIEKKLDAND